jgi:glycerophosphoryl diester phosphodiesterase
MKRKIALGVVGLLLVVYAVLAWRVEPAPEYAYFVEGERPLVMAHQGGERLYPGNTLLAMQESVALGVDVLEMDIHASSDGVLVVIHDDTVDRTTDGTGAVKEMTFAELSQLDAGYYWTEDEGATYPYRGQGITIPSFAEILATFPDMRLNVEIKPPDPAVAQAACDLLRQHGAAERALVGTVHDEVVTTFRAACPESPSSMVESEIRPFWILSTLFLGQLYQSPTGAAALQVPERASLPILGEVEVITPRFVRTIHKHNLEIHAWTINETADMERLLATGIDGIITDRPDLMLELIGR